MMLLCTAVLAALLAAAPAFSSSAGFGPIEYSKGDELIVKANELTSIKAQVPYPYYSQPFCKPDGALNNTPGIWQIVTGDRQDISPYVFEMGQAKMCQIVCRTAVGEQEAMELAAKIKDEYRINMALDKLPLVILIRLWSTNGDLNHYLYQRGYHVGVTGQYAGSTVNSHFIHNHLSFLVKYRRSLASGASRIVGFVVKPYSVKHQMEGQWNGVNTRLSTCNPQANRFIRSSESHEIKVGEDIIYTYDVNFQETDIKWESRWDMYVSITNDEARWFSVVNSLAMILILSSMLAMTALRTMYREISKWNQLDAQEEASGGSSSSTGTGWKLVHGDVFRPPSNPGLLCVYVGTGAQLAGTLLLTMVAALLGFVSPSNCIELRTTIVLIWVLMGLIAGYASSRLNKMFNGLEWKKITLVTASLLPGVAYAVFFVSNALLYSGNHSSAAIPFTTMLALVLIWCGISLPLVFVGSYIGFKKPAIEPPIEANNIPRKIPGQRAMYMHPAFTASVAGLLPLGPVLNEFFLLLNSFWIGQFCHSFGLLFVAFVVLIVTCAETSILVCFFQLRSEDYRWWWRSYITTGCSAIYLFMYATFYFFMKLQITELVPSMMYFGYMLVVSYAFFLLTGTLGFASCFFFMRLIYSQGVFG